MGEKGEVDGELKYFLSKVKKKNMPGSYFYSRLEDEDFQDRQFQEDWAFNRTNITTMLGKADSEFTFEPAKVYMELIRGNVQKTRSQQDREWLAVKSGGVEADKQGANERRQDYGERSESNEILERALFLEFHNWLNNQVEAYQGSDYDDFRNGADVVLHIPGTDDYLSIDVTIDPTRGRVEKKLDTTCESIARGELTPLKYHLEHNAKPTFQSRFVPHVVVNVSLDTATALWGAAVGTKKADIKVYRGQVKMILNQIKQQCEMFQAYLQDLEGDDYMGQRAAKNAKKFTPFLDIINSKLDELAEQEIPTDDACNEQFQELLNEQKKYWGMDHEQEKAQSAGM